MRADIRGASDVALSDATFMRKGRGTYHYEAADREQIPDEVLPFRELGIGSFQLAQELVGCLRVRRHSSPVAIM